MWTPPPSPSIKINVDASWKHGACSAWVGMVVRDSGSRCIAVKRVEVSASCASLAESLAVLEGCNLAKSLNIPRVVVESDSKQVISCLNNCSLSYAWEVFPICNHISVVGEDFPSLLLVLGFKISKYCGRLCCEELYSRDVQLCLG